MDDLHSIVAQVVFVLLAVTSVLGSAAALWGQRSRAFALAITLVATTGIYLAFRAFFAAMMHAMLFGPLVFVLYLTDRKASHETILSPPSCRKSVAAAVVAGGIFLVMLYLFFAFPIKSEGDCGGAGSPAISLIGDNMAANHILPLEVAPLLFATAIAGAGLMTMEKRKWS